MVHHHPGASQFGRAACIRRLLARAAAHDTSVEAIWALAVARQLLEEHLADIEACLVRSRHPAQQTRCHEAQLAWIWCFVTIRARVEHLGV
jgi:hypothetical protein